MQIQLKLSTTELIGDIKNKIRVNNFQHFGSPAEKKRLNQTNDLSELSTSELSHQIVLAIQKARGRTVDHNKAGPHSELAKRATTSLEILECAPSLLSRQNGTIKDNDSMLSLIQNLIETRKDGVLVIRLGKNVTYTIRFRKGAVESASSSKPDKNGPAGCLWNALCAKQGNYSFEEGTLSERGAALENIDPVQSRFISKNIGDIVASRKADQVSF